MTDQGTKAFQFDLSETLFFHRQEGVSEMLGIGLDPEISIQDFPDHVAIRGIIALTGEYLPSEIDQSETTIDEIDSPQLRYFKSVERDEDGICEFVHHFPVDISIPHERISRLEDLSVGVDSFDYHLPEPCKLELEATVVIQGLEHERINSIEEPIADEQAEEEEERIEFDLKLKSTENEEKQDRDLQVADDEAPVEEESIEESNIVVLQRGVPEEEPIVEAVRVEPEQEIEPEETLPRPTSLLDLFDHEGSDEDRYAQMKMYIVQQDDSLDQIADKYGIQVSKIQRANQLDTSMVEEGQIIYVPV
ncbi:LysM peptidoglycan-binding domain-containing protein [Amphibacillus marinus]|uniref:LysM peptidoglycan-binding domain-containing protein n=1 Tax=Amphibacillus marinus TaxID=872970 RepID=UPI000B87A345|nr:LysM peptidoglycan-binding domain-containing protein [Amphibacillus marinus]